MAHVLIVMYQFDSIARILYFSDAAAAAAAITFATFLEIGMGRRMADWIHAANAHSINRCLYLLNTLSDLRIRVRPYQPCFPKMTVRRMALGVTE